MQKIKVFFDNTIFVLQKIGGISIVFKELITRIKSKEEFTITWVLNTGSQNNLFFNSLANGMDSVKEFPIMNFILPFMPLLKRLPAGAIFHSTYNRYSFQSNIKKVITIHDLGYERGVMRTGFKRSVHLFFKKIAIKNANAIICISESTQKDLKYFYDDILSNTIIKVIYNGLSEEYFLPSDVIVPMQSKRYVLYVGARHGYKNFDNVVKAVSEIDDFELFVCGGGEFSGKEISFLDLYLKNRYSTHLNLSNLQLKEMYRNAFCLVYPSSYEGFGLPILEAMASECPVIACNNSSIPEISGESAILISEPKVVLIKNAIVQLFDNELRQTLIKKGKINAKKYSWDKAAIEILNLYKELVDENI